MLKKKWWSYSKYLIILWSVAKKIFVPVWFIFHMNLQWYKDYPTSDKKLTGVDVAISVVVTFIFIKRWRHINLLITRRCMYFTSTVGRKLISIPWGSRSTPDKNFTSVEKVTQGSG